MSIENELNPWIFYRKNEKENFFYKKNFLSPSLGLKLQKKFFSVLCTFSPISLELACQISRLNSQRLRHGKFLKFHGYPPQALLDPKNAPITCYCAQTVKRTATKFWLQVK